MHLSEHLQERVIAAVVGDQRRVALAILLDPSHLFLELGIDLHELAVFLRQQLLNVSLADEDCLKVLPLALDGHKHL